MQSAADAVIRTASGEEKRQAIQGQWFRVRSRLTRQTRFILGFASVLLPLLLWSAVSYVPFIWHPDILISDPGDVDYFQPGMRIDKATFASEVASAKKHATQTPVGSPAKTDYLSAPGH